MTVSVTVNKPRLLRRVLRVIARAHGFRYVSRELGAHYAEGYLVKGLFGWNYAAEIEARVSGRGWGGRGELIFRAWKAGYDDVLTAMAGELDAALPDYHIVVERWDTEQCEEANQ